MRTCQGSSPSGPLRAEAPVPHAEPTPHSREPKQGDDDCRRRDDEYEVACPKPRFAVISSPLRTRESASVHRDRDLCRAPRRVREERDEFSHRFTNASERAARNGPAHATREAHLRVLVGEERQKAVAGEQRIADSERQAGVPDEAYDEISRIGRPDESEREHADREPAQGYGEPEAKTGLGGVERSDGPGWRLARRREDRIAPDEANAEQAERHERARDRDGPGAAGERGCDRDREEQQGRHGIDHENENERDCERRGELHRGIDPRERLHTRTASRAASAACTALRPVSDGISGSRSRARANAPATDGSASPKRQRSEPANSSSGVASKPIAPPAIASARSASSATSERSWVMRTTVVPRSRSSRRIATSSRVFRRSCPNVGSSRISTLGLGTRALATERRRFSPCESECGFASASRASPNRSSSSSGSRAIRRPSLAA